MNSIKIEMGAVLALKNVIQLNDLMKEYINDNDKEPSWDGFIYLYKSDDMKDENIKYRIPVQVKGKNQEDLLKKQRISYPVEYKHVYCKIELPKVANENWRMLHLQIGESCKTFAKSSQERCSA